MKIKVSAHFENNPHRQIVNDFFIFGNELDGRAWHICLYTWMSSKLINMVYFYFIIEIFLSMGPNKKKRI